MPLEGSPCRNLFWERLLPHFPPQVTALCGFLSSHKDCRRHQFRQSRLSLPVCGKGTGKCKMWKQFKKFSTQTLGDPCRQRCTRSLCVKMNGRVSAHSCGDQHYFFGVYSYGAFPSSPAVRVDHRTRVDDSSRSSFQSFSFSLLIFQSDKTEDSKLMLRVEPLDERSLFSWPTHWTDSEWHINCYYIVYWFLQLCVVTVRLSWHKVNSYK